MASDLDTVRVLRALFNDMPQAPQGLTQLETVAWIQQAMSEFEGGETAYTIEHITRNSMLDLVLRMREDGPYQDDAAFDQVVEQISTPEGRKQFMDWCILARKSVDATARLLNRAKPAWSEPGPFFTADADEVARFVAGEVSGPGPLFSEYATRADVRGVGVFEQEPERVHEFDWGFVTEEPGAWNFYVAEVWRRGTVGYFERFLSAWLLETGAAPATGAVPPPVPFGLEVGHGIETFSALRLLTEGDMADPALRRWLGDVFISLMLPAMAGRSLDEDYDFPLAVQPDA
ncbi:hypothetical protein KBW71_22805 [Hydrogenophaga aromaticivorans]|uniref:hypothetical protein n=1 Tax=Hydrogenophaga aromaticivorans TaxID=2610898 RepID=UPI001B35BF4A|nr:hypothetical protein [Hydrogenophaga aromaticivorans]MBQ0921277.1 hypothetical protein [Hydrogenophaga aromaticivorans]